MSPRINPDFDAVTATIPIFDKGEYEFEVGKPKAFLREGDKGQVSGIRYKVTMVDGKDAGKFAFLTCWTHSDGGLGFSKQFVMAADGFDVTRAGEDAFDKQYPPKESDWSYDTDSGDVGEMWQLPEGKRVLISVDIQPNPKTGEPNQQWSKYRPVK